MEGTMLLDATAMGMARSATSVAMSDTATAM